MYLCNHLPESIAFVIRYSTGTAQFTESNTICSLNVFLGEVRVHCLMFSNLMSVLIQAFNS